MKKAESIVRSEFFPSSKISDYEWNLYVETHDLVKDFIRITKLAQEDAIRETVKECNKNVKMKVIANDGNDRTVEIIDSNSILSVADKLIKEL